MKGKLIGLGIFVLVAGLAIGIYLFGNGGGGHGAQVVVKGYTGGEKVSFFADPEIVKILKNKYGITVEATKAGSIEMVDMAAQGVDFLFPSSQTALEIFQDKGKTALKKERIFSSPIVFFSWKDVYAALEKQGVVQKKDKTVYMTKLDEFLGYIVDNKKWSDLGVNIYGSVKVISTDPNKSNSGMMYSALLANTLNSGQVVDGTTIDAQLPKVKAVFDKLGQMESSSANLFERYLTLGMGDSPIIAGYENQIIEFALEKPELWSKVKDAVSILYPEPTVWAEHYFMALSDNGKRLCDALLDEDIQKLAWQKHGFRTGMVTQETDGTIMDTVGIPGNITQVMPMPKADVVQKLLDYLNGTAK